MVDDVVPYSMKTRSILTSLIAVAALGAATLSGIAGENGAVSTAANGELPGEWPKLISSVAPKYPAKLLANKIEGDVTVAFVVTKDGEVTQVRAVSSDHPEFAAAAIEALKQWRYSPGLKSGRPVNTEMKQPVRFELPKGADAPAKQ